MLNTKPCTRLQKTLKLFERNEACKSDLWHCVIDCVWFVQVCTCMVAILDNHTCESFGMKCDSAQGPDIVTSISNIILSVGQHRVESELMYKKSGTYKDD